MSLLKKPCVITVSGVGNRGKTTALLELIKLYVNPQPVNNVKPVYKVYEYVYSSKTNSFKTIPPLSKKRGKDRLVYVEFPNGGIRCGISTGGDVDTYVARNLAFLESIHINGKKGCDFYITATHGANSKTFDAARKFALSMNKSSVSGCEFLPIAKAGGFTHYDNDFHNFLFSLIK